MRAREVWEVDVSLGSRLAVIYRSGVGILLRKDMNVTLTIGYPLILLLHCSIFSLRYPKLPVPLAGLTKPGSWYLPTYLPASSFSSFPSPQSSSGRFSAIRLACCAMIDLLWPAPTPPLSSSLPWTAFVLLPLPTETRKTPFARKTHKLPSFTTSVSFFTTWAPSYHPPPKTSLWISPALTNHVEPNSGSLPAGFSFPSC